LGSEGASVGAKVPAQAARRATLREDLEAGDPAAVGSGVGPLESGGAGPATELVTPRTKDRRS